MTAQLFNESATKNFNEDKLNKNTQPLKLLYICTHNRCRSVLSEAITNQLGEGKLSAKSAGSTPAGQVHPLTLKYLEKNGYAIDGLSSNGWDDQDYMADFEPDVLVTVCDNAAGESCPVWLGNLPNLTKLHWGLKDPSKNTEDEAVSDRNFNETINIIEQRVKALVQLVDKPLDERKALLMDLVS